MRRHIFIPALLLSALTAAAAAGVYRGPEARPFDHPHHPRRFLVRFQTALTVEVMNRARKRAGVTPVRRLPLIPNLYLMSDEGRNEPEETLRRLLEDEDVLFAEPDYLWKKTDTIPDDPLFGELWGLEKTAAPKAWSLNTGTRDIVVAVIDTGVDYTHPDLKDNMWENSDGTHGYNALDGSRDPFDDNWHGTHVAGTIGAVGDNSLGVAGVNWNVRIMALKFLNSFGLGSTSDAIECINFAVENGAHILNNSWGGGPFSYALLEAIEEADRAGVLFVAAAGNSAGNLDYRPFYPASYPVPNVIAVASTEPDDSLALLSNYGAASVHVAAPGSNILSTEPGDDYGYASGTSMAAPHVSGLAALIMGFKPELDHLTVKEIISSSVDRIDALDGKVKSGGRINLHRGLLYSSFIPPSHQGDWHWHFPSVGTGIKETDFDSYLMVFNPGLYPAEVAVAYQDKSGPAGNGNLTVPPLTRRTIAVRDVFGDGKPGVSAVITSNRPVICEQAAYWPAGRFPWRGGHNSPGVNRLSKRWYLAEGAVHIFDQFIHLLNPDPDNPTDVEITFSNQNGVIRTHSLKIGPAANHTVETSEVAGENHSQLSAIVNSDRPIAVTRSMFWNGGEAEWIGGHSSPAAPETSDIWYFAEGATHNFDQYLAILNPSATETAEVEVNFRDSSSPISAHGFMIAPGERLTVKVNDLVGRRAEVSATVSSNIGVAAERTMYWSAGGKTWEDGHNSLGVTTAALNWYLAEGATHLFDQSILIHNPSPSREAVARITFQNDSGAIEQRERVVAPSGRITVNAGREAGSWDQLSAIVESANGAGIIVERAMYWSPGGGYWTGGHASPGFPLRD